jgi:hypothetical protein
MVRPLTASQPGTPARSRRTGNVDETYQMYCHGKERPTMPPHHRRGPPGRTDAPGPPPRSDGTSPILASHDVAADGPRAIDWCGEVDLAAVAPSRGTISAVMDEDPMLWRSLSLGVDVSGNATAVGASANVVLPGIAERADRRINRWRFTRCGLVVIAFTIALCVLGLWLCYLAFAG